MSDVPLGRLQRWMQQVIVHPGRIEDALAAPDATLPAEQVSALVRPTAALSAADRVAIYHGMYLLRMEEALQTDYAGLQHFLGATRFRELVRAYVQQHPSRSYTLNRLGDHLPAWIRTAVGVPRREFCHDLARLELAVSEVFDAEETPPLGAETIGAVAPDDWERAVLTPIAALRLLELRYPANDWLDALRDDDHRHPPTRQRPTYLLVHRRSYSIRRHELGRDRFLLLQDIVAGQTLGAALAAALARGGRRGAPAAEDLFAWFREWMSLGLFRAVRVMPPSAAI